MTDKQRLQVNNEALQEIKETLAKKVIMIQTGTDTVEIELPEIFTTAKDFYWYQVNSDTFLLSANVKGVGIWSYHIKSKTFKQCWTNAYWRNYYQITDKLVLITSGTGITGVLLYDVETDEITTTDIGYYGTLYIYKVDDDRFLIACSGGTNSGVKLFYTSTRTSELKHNVSSSWRNFARVGDSILISSSNNNTGLLRFDVLTNEMSLIHTTGYWEFLTAIGNKCFISSNSSTILGLLQYNDSDKSLKTISTEGYYWNSFIEVDGKVFVSGKNYLKGLYLIEDDTVTQIYADGYNYTYAHKIKDRAVINNTSKFLLIYDFTNKSIERIDTPNGGYCAYSVEIGDKLLLTSAYTNYEKLHIYHYDTNTVSENASAFKFSNYDIFRLDGENCYLSSSKSDKVMILYYTNADDSVTLAGAKLEVKL